MKILDRMLCESAVKEAVLQSTAFVVADMVTGEILLSGTSTDAMFGYDSDELDGQVVDVLLPTESRNRHKDYRALYADHPRARPMGTGMILRGRHKDGTTFPIQVSLSPSYVLDRKVVVAIILDLTEPVKTAQMIQSVVDIPS